MPKAKRITKEFENFDRAMDQLLRVPHSEIKKKLDAEKEEKRKRKAAKTPSRVSSPEKPSST
jgi:hypothetical protein